MDVPGSSNQRDRHRRSTSARPSSPEKKSQLRKLWDRLFKSRRVDSESVREIEMTSMCRALEQCLAEESSSAKALEKCIEDKIDLNTPITKCGKIVRQYGTFRTEFDRAADTRNEEKRMYEDLHEEHVEILPTSQLQGGTQVAKRLQKKTAKELEKEIMETIKKGKALEEELKAALKRESRRR